jgi:hypothetical protein
MIFLSGGRAPRGTLRLVKNPFTEELYCKVPSGCIIKQVLETRNRRVLDSTLHKPQVAHDPQRTKNKFRIHTDVKLVKLELEIIHNRWQEATIPVS